MTLDSCLALEPCTEVVEVDPKSLNHHLVIQLFEMFTMFTFENLIKDEKSTISKKKLWKAIMWLMMSIMIIVNSNN